MLGMLFYLQDLFEEKSEPVIYTNEEGIIQYVNPKCVEFFNISKEELLKKNINILVPNEEKDKHNNYISNYFKTKLSKVIGVGLERRFLKSNGQEVLIYLSITHVKEGKHPGFLVTVKDETEKDLREQALALKAHELIVKKRNSQQLVHVLCHDLLNPLGAIISRIDLKEVIGETLTKLEVIVKKLILQSTGILDEVKIMMAIEEGKLKLDLEFEDFRECLEQSLFILSTRIERKKIKINMNFNESIKVLVSRNSFISTVLNNIISNAIKFSEKDSEMDITFKKEKQMVFINFRDYGVGMDKDLLEKVFSSDLPTTRAGVDGEKGTGFGMPLIQRFVESFEGSIELESWDQKTYPENHGTLITLVLWCQN